jgi:hypothetical protein
MSDLNHDPSQPHPTDPKVVRIRWQRVSIYLGSIALIVAMWLCALLFMIRYDPGRFVDHILAQLPQPSSAYKVYWVNRRTLEIDDIKIGGFFYADSIIITASPFGLIRRHVAKVQVLGGQVFTKPLYAAMDSKAGATASDDSGLNWTIGRLEISRGTLMLENLLPDTSIPVRLGVRWPVVLYDIHLNKPDESPEMTKEQIIEVENVYFVSPFDPLSPVLALPLTRVKFTYTEFWHHHIREIQLIKPTLFVGEDLFWFTSEFRKMRKSLPTQGPTAPWEVGQFEIDYGLLAVNAFGQPVVQFPFFFDTKVSDIRLDQLDKISAKSTINIQRLNQNYPDYKIDIVGLTGNLYFSLPPTDDNANNVVNTISVDEISWNDIPVTKASSTMTFDPNGIYGKLSGACEGGELSGNFEFYYNKGFVWNVDFFAQKINCQPIAEKLGGKYLTMTGELDGKLSVEGQVTDIQKVQGTLTLPKAGVVHIKSLDDLMGRLPADTSALKRDTLKIAIQALETYPYSFGQVKLDYVNNNGVGSLILDGPDGRRQFDMYLHPWTNPEASSKVAKNGDNQ